MKNIMEKLSAKDRTQAMTIAIRRGIITAADIHGDLFDLCGSNAQLRTSPQETTVFKSVGLALEDLAAASLVAQR